uniref:Uncharacterized protein n=1 Tax=Oryza brachyantha TaxID=4533 RepID=J3MH39_ORYBR
MSCVAETRLSWALTPLTTWYQLPDDPLPPPLHYATPPSATSLVSMANPTLADLATLISMSGYGRGSSGSLNQVVKGVSAQDSRVLATQLVEEAVEAHGCSPKFAKVRKRDLERRELAR